jgi:hypothetical protein
MLYDLWSTTGAQVDSELRIGDSRLSVLLPPSLGIDAKRDLQ